VYEVNMVVLSSRRSRYKSPQPTLTSVSSLKALKKK
jgi:hypothetical protein